jgi:small ligand-binding sensory domain FIST
MEAVHSVSAHWTEGPDAAAIRELPGKLGAPPTLGLIFIAPKLFANAKEILELVQIEAKVPTLIGCSGASLIATDREFEEQPGVALGLYALPGAKLDVFHLTQEQVEEATGPGYWQMETGIEQTNGWLAFVDPFTFNCDAWLNMWNEAYAGRPTLGGLASGELTDQSTQLYWNSQIFEEGALVMSVGGDVEVAGVISQGCTPIGDTWTITRAEGHYIHEIGNRPAYEVLVQTLNALPDAEKRTLRGNLFIGIVVNEYLEEFHRGDFLIRNLIGVDPNTGTLAVGATPRVGQTIQFQRRDAKAGTEDIEALLQRATKQLGSKPVYGACLCSCNGRGQRMFGRPHHDAGHVQSVLGPLGLAGFFCNGELGPVGEKNFVHGYTASLALFVKK